MSDEKRGGVLLRESSKAGDMGWILMKHGEIFSTEFGWDTDQIEEYTARTIAEFLSLKKFPTTRGWIAEMNGTRLGSVLCYEDLEQKQTMRLRMLIVSPEGRGKGIGTSLINSVIQFTKSCGLKKIKLYTTSVQTDVIKIYERMGFRLVRIEEENEFGPQIKGHIYELDL